jgi:hypothetical protein
VESAYRNTAVYGMASAYDEDVEFKWITEVAPALAFEGHK